MLKAIVDNTSRTAIPGVGMVNTGSSAKKRWIELADEKQEANPKEQKEEPKEDTRTCKEIADGIMQRMRGGKNVRAGI